ncbi:hypothetical protein ACLI1A_14950 [Flavobacterium sp. RHBU_3]|uniref:hypothetical protein n=1 Tax=Flavobacterium sp. RHBU_3 TaxID=3391184 RepID=UPI0039847D3F
MKKFILLLLFIASASVNAQSTNECNRFHTGTFKYLDNRFGTITRTETRQREVNEKNGNYFDGTIKWLSDCEYEITLEKSNATGTEEMMGKPIRAAIVAISGNVATIQFIAPDGSKGYIKIEKVEIQ